MTRSTSNLCKIPGFMVQSAACLLLSGGMAAVAAPGDTGSAVPAAALVPASVSSPAPSSPPAAAEPKTAPAQRVVAGVYRGTFGSSIVEMTLTQDKDAEDSVHGWYVLLGSANAEHVQLAGEWEDDTLTMEESHNGVDVSGSWSAIFNADGFAGQWSDINGEHAIDIDLHRVKTTINPKKKL